MSLLPAAPEPRMVLSADGVPIATYDAAPDPAAITGAADPDTAPVVLAVHGFASSAWSNWYATGWVRALTRAGYRVIAIDQRGHGASGKPHDPARYTMEALVGDVQAVLDASLLDDVTFVGYSLGARVGWHAALDSPHLIARAVLGGIPDGDPLTRFQLDQARAFVAGGAPIADRLTETYVTMASNIRGNDLTALIALVEGMRGGRQPNAANPPLQPMLFAAGSDDPILPGTRALSAAAPTAEFFEIPGRDHFSAPASRAFRDRAIEFLQRTAHP